MGEHEGGEFFAREFSGAIEEGAVEIFVNGDLAGVEGWKAKIVAILEFFPIDIECFAGGFAGVAIPAVGQDDAADVSEQCGNARHGGGFLSVEERMGRRDSTAIEEALANRPSLRSLGICEQMK